MNVAKLVNPAFDHLWESNATNIIESGGRASTKSSAISIAQKSINWTIFIQLLRQHLRYDCDYKN
ncbi:hypothetical protein EFE27_04835 [Leuconostoc citreum]|uniref:hypothetical protein n=1 Tax=Leuconostoc citreum TaxID=33964 RepID=UPI002181F7B3|nr:hypothetical protein [Leuconostoc citreum]MCS8595297.1 hypothetical protein [Leuconostoc citreum]